MLDGRPSAGPRSRDHPTVSRQLFIQALGVPPGAIDFNRHVNNVQFVQWLQDVAMAHSTACGWPLARYLSTNGSWVVRSHFIEYLRPAVLGDEVLLATWIAGFERETSPRRTLVWRPRDRKLLARAETVWVFVDARSGRGQAIPADFVSAFDTTADERLALQALRAWQPLAGLHPRAGGEAGVQAP